MEGKFRDASAFSGDPVVEVKEALSATGYHFEGKDILYSGVTGEPLEAYIFKGPIYYQKLKHMVVDKVSCPIYLLGGLLFQGHVH